MFENVMGSLKVEGLLDFGVRGSEKMQGNDSGDGQVNDKVWTVNLHYAENKRRNNRKTHQITWTFSTHCCELNNYLDKLTVTSISSPQANSANTSPARSGYFPAAAGREGISQCHQQMNHEYPGVFEHAAIRVWPVDIRYAQHSYFLPTSH
jgi:hypothetical protein